MGGAVSGVGFWVLLNWERGGEWALGTNQSRAGRRTAASRSAMHPGALTSAPPRPPGPRRTQGNGVIVGLGICGVVLAATSSAATLMGDFRTGYICLAAPRAMFGAQLVGQLVGAVVTPLAFMLFFKTGQVRARVGETGWVGGPVMLRVLGGGEQERGRARPMARHIIGPSSCMRTQRARDIGPLHRRARPGQRARRPLPGALCRHLPRCAPPPQPPRCPPPAASRARS